MYYSKIEIATPSALQKARNDRKGEVASLLAMTKRLTPRNDNW